MLAHVDIDACLQPAHCDLISLVKKGKGPRATGVVLKIISVEWKETKKLPSLKLEREGEAKELCGRHHSQVGNQFFVRCRLHEMHARSLSSGSEMDW